MFVKKPSFWLTSLAGFFLFSSLFAVNVRAADDEDAAGLEGKSATGFEEQEASSSNFTGSKVAELPYVLPNLYKRHLVSSFSLGYVSQTRGGEETSRDMYTSVSASFAYNLQRKHSDYVFDYRTSGRHSNRFREANTFTHDLGLSQIVQLSPRTSWILNHRFSYTPDFSGRLLRENLAEELALSNPVPPGGVGSIAMLVNPFPELQAPTDGLDNTLRSTRMTNSTSANLVHQLSARTNLSFQAGYHRAKYSEGGLFESNNYSLSAGMTRMFTARTSIGFNYLAGRSDYAGTFGRTMYQNAGISLTHQVTPSSIFTVTVQPSLISAEGQQVIPLSPVLAHLLGRPALFRDSSQSFISWVGGAGFRTQWRHINLGLRYNRSISNTNGLGGQATVEGYTVSLGRALQTGTYLSVSASYLRNQMIRILDVPKLDQKAFSVTLTRKLGSGLDVSVFFSHSRLLTNGVGPLGFNSNQFGVGFTYHFPRVSGS